MIDLHVGDVGTEIRVTVLRGRTALNISAATVTKFKFRRGDKTVFQVDAQFTTDGTDGKLSYFTQTGDLSTHGKWAVQAYIELPSWQGHSSITEFEVEKNLEITVV